MTKDLIAIPSLFAILFVLYCRTKKLNHQQVFKQSTSEKDTKVAKVRNLIENLNADLKQYRGFERELPLSRIDMAAHEVISNQ